jgi:tetratricopeptide (TPR) repeat protein
MHTSSSGAETAASEFTTATQLSPDLAWAWNDLGYVRIQQEQFDQAIPPLREATRLRDDVACFYNNLGVALERTGDLIGARIAYGKAGQLGHELASNSSQRVETVLLARGVDPSRWEQVGGEGEAVGGGAWALPLFARSVKAPTGTDSRGAPLPSA